jgi:signal transduction histidine kinase
MTAQADVLGRLLVLQQTLVALPDEARIAEFTRRALQTVPGVGNVTTCIGGKVVPPNPDLDVLCGKCADASAAPAALDIAACDAESGARCFPIWTASRLFGLLIVHVADEALLRPYLGFVANIAGAVALTLYSRQFQDRLTVANEELRNSRDILELRVAERTREVVRGNERRRRLSLLLINAQEDERRRIARELHDEIGQAFAAVRIRLEITSRHAETDAARVQLQHGIELIDHALELIHNLALDLRPPQLDDLGLAAALRWHIDRQSQASGIPITFDADEIPARMRPELTITCFRIVQEALTNIIRHAHARHAWIELRRKGGTLVLTMRDDGRGFNADAKSPNSMGLLGMEERLSLIGGHLAIDSSAGKGTSIVVTLPVRKLPARIRDATKVTA